MLRNYFVAGLLTLLPIVITLDVGYRLFSFFDGLLGSYIRGPAGRHLPGLGLVVLVTLLTGVGALVSNLLGRHLIRGIDLAFNRTPVLKSIYDASKQLVTTVFDRQAAAFKTVVLVPFPNGESHLMGFLVSEHALDVPPKVAVFVPFSPPTSGYLILVDADKVVRTDLSTEDAMKMILSGGTFGALGSTFHAIGLESLLGQALAHPGFAFVEVLTDCPELFGRHNKLGDGGRMLLRQKEQTVPEAKARRMSPEDLEGKDVIGVLWKSERPEFSREYAELRARLASGRVAG